MEGQLTKYPFICPRIFCQCKFLLELPLSLADLCSLCTQYALYWVSEWSRSVMSDSLRPHGHQVPPSTGFSRQEYWSGLSFSSPGNLPNPGIKLMSPVSPTLAARVLAIGKPLIGEGCNQSKLQWVSRWLLYMPGTLIRGGLIEGQFRAQS